MYVCVYVYLYMYMCMLIYTYMYIYIHTCIFIYIGLDELANGKVLKCSICKSYGLIPSRGSKMASGSSAANQTKIEKTQNLIENAPKSNDKNENDGDNSCNNEFSWCWWDGKAPYCPFCGILMLPLT
jgi:hypothetical protein